MSDIQNIESILRRIERHLKDLNQKVDSFASNVDGLVRDQMDANDERRRSAYEDHGVDVI